MHIAKIHLDHWLEYASVRGINESKLSPPANVFQEDAEPANTITTTYFYEMVKAIYDELNDELLGIKAGEFLNLKLLGLIYQVSLQTHTIEEALHYLSTYLHATFPIITAETNVTENAATITFSVTGKYEEVSRMVLENTLTIVSREISMMAADEIQFVLTSPYHNNRYPEAWQKAGTYSISFAPVLLKAAIQNRTSQQLDILVPQYLQLMEGYKATASFSSKVKVTMLSLSDPALPSINKVAEALYVTPRTLQRKLEAEETSFRFLSEELKKAIASSLLRHKGYSITSLAYVLGYSDAASFNHSYKKWFGIAPEKMRERYQA
jgi:AraC-like DNA-binding protein